MIVCSYCLEAIESHEGKQIHRHLSWLDDSDLANENDEVFCEWCEEWNDLAECCEI